jgi:hypothetical protein
MEGKRSFMRREVKRVGKPHRLEEELWVAVYERICPLVRRKVNPPAAREEHVKELAAAANIARRA